MLSRIFLSDDDTLNTKCARCKNYLSVPPIFICLKDLVCGRCIKECENFEDSRAFFYEDLAKYMFFPCKNDIYGCSVQVPWGKVLDHESSCKFARIICPVTDCDNKIGSEEVVHHFRINHEDDILKGNECELLLPRMVNSWFTCKLFIWMNHPFFIQTTTRNNKFYLKVLYLNEIAVKDLKFTCVFNNEDSSKSISLSGISLNKYKYKYKSELSNKEEIDISFLRNILGPQVTCVFNFENEGKSPKCDLAGHKIVSELECPVCTDFMKPPIYMCRTGHSLCASCRAKLSSCPSCSTDFNDSRNYSLENITEIVTYPCKNRSQGCDFVSNLTAITFHEQTCSKSYENEISCFLNDVIPCNWTGSYEKIFQHISLLHPDHCIQLGCPISIDVSAFEMKNWFFLYDKKIFKLYVDNNKFGTNRIRWAVSHIDTTEEFSEKYMFYLDILSGKRIFATNEICRNVTVDFKKESGSHYVNVPVTLFNSFIKKNKLSFKLYVTPLI